MGSKTTLDRVIQQNKRLIAAEKKIKERNFAKADVIYNEDRRIEKVFKPFDEHLNSAIEPLKQQQLSIMANGKYLPAIYNRTDYMLSKSLPAIEKAASASFKESSEGRQYTKTLLEKLASIQAQTQGTDNSIDQTEADEPRTLYTPAAIDLPKTIDTKTILSDRVAKFFAAPSQDSMGFKFTKIPNQPLGIRLGTATIGFFKENDDISFEFEDGIIARIPGTDGLYTLFTNRNPPNGKKWSDEPLVTPQDIKMFKRLIYQSKACFDANTGKRVSSTNSKYRELIMPYLNRIADGTIKHDPVGMRSRSNSASSSRSIQGSGLGENEVIVLPSNPKELKARLDTILGNIAAKHNNITANTVHEGLEILDRVKLQPMFKYNARSLLKEALHSVK